LSNGITTIRKCQSFAENVNRFFSVNRRIHQKLILSAPTADLLPMSDRHHGTWLRLNLPIVVPTNRLNARAPTSALEYPTDRMISLQLRFDLTNNCLTRVMRCFVLACDRVTRSCCLNSSRNERSDTPSALAKSEILSMRKIFVLSTSFKRITPIVARIHSRGAFPPCRYISPRS
jgi:hypothetical protein